MKCGVPTRGSKGESYKCNKCASCLESNRRDFVTRVLLELGEFPESTYITLDISPERYPADKDAAKAQLKRFLRGLKFRYVFVPERCPTSSHRLHWHGIVFGVPFVDLKSSLAFWEPRWPYGGVTVRRADPASGRYIAKYISGSHYTEDALNFYDGIGYMRPRWCRSPALACGKFVEAVAAAYEKSRHLRERVALTGDVIPVIRTDGKTIAIPYAVKRKLRERLGIPSSSPVRDLIAASRLDFEKKNPEHPAVKRLRAQAAASHSAQVARRGRDRARALFADSQLRAAEAAMKRAVARGEYVPASVRRAKKKNVPVDWARITPRRRGGSDG